MSAVRPRMTTTSPGSTDATLWLANTTDPAGIVGAMLPPAILSVEGIVDSASWSTSTAHGSRLSITGDHLPWRGPIHSGEAADPSIGFPLVFNGRRHESQGRDDRMEHRRSVGPSDRERNRASFLSCQRSHRFERESGRGRDSLRAAAADQSPRPPLSNPEPKISTNR